MKIVKEHINEIKRGGSSGLASIGVGSEAIRNSIKQWVNSVRLIYGEYLKYGVDYIINDQFEIILKKQTNYLKLLYVGIPSHIKFKFKPNYTAFGIAVYLKDDEMFKKLLEDYKKLNIPIPSKYQKLINDLKYQGYICISTQTQFNHDVIAIVDTKKGEILYIHFYDDGIIKIRRGDVLRAPYYRVKSDHVKTLNNVNIIDNYDQILSVIIKI